MAGVTLNWFSNYLTKEQKLAFRNRSQYFIIPKYITTEVTPGVYSWPVVVSHLHERPPKRQRFIRFYVIGGRLYTNQHNKHKLNPD